LKGKIETLCRGRKNLIRYYETSYKQPATLQKPLEDIATAYTETCLLAPKPTVADKVNKDRKTETVVGEKQEQQA